MKATLIGPSGNVDAVLITASSDLAKLVRVGEAHLVPTAPLQPNTRYTATFVTANPQIRAKDGDRGSVGKDSGKNKDDAHDHDKESQSMKGRSFTASFTTGGV
ncbi:MAG: hypothetical protein NVS3B20_20090 [Polyangiales bacterium]